MDAQFGGRQVGAPETDGPSCPAENAAWVVCRGGDGTSGEKGTPAPTATPKATPSPTVSRNPNLPPHTHPKNRYAERLPIGLESVIRGAPAAAVRAFYERHYRPERMAVVAVGDFDDPGGF